MIHRIALVAQAIVALTVLGGCDRSNPAATAPGNSAISLSDDASSLSNSSPRSGVLHATKSCPDYKGNAGDFCSITSSNLGDIEVGSKIYYAKPLVDGRLDSDLILVPPGNGNSIAFGHVVLDVTTMPPHGLVTFSGGTGKFRHFTATINVSPIDRLNPDFVNWNWDGPYSLAERENDRENGARR